MAESATEWTDSASMELEPVSRNATNLVTAIPRLADSAATMAFVPPCVDTLAAYPPRSLLSASSQGCGDDGTSASLPSVTSAAGTLDWRPLG